jgi:hypothetical protein
MLKNTTAKTEIEAARTTVAKFTEALLVDEMLLVRRVARTRTKSPEFR